MRDNITTHLLIVILTEVKFAPTSLCYTDRLCTPEFLCIFPVSPYFILLFKIRVEVLDFYICRLMINADFQFGINIAVWRITVEGM